MAEFLVQSASGTDIGTVRKTNEDSYLDDPLGRVWVVADGMGGHDSGDVASAMVVDGLRGLGGIEEIDALRADIAARVGAANRELVALGREGDGRVIGTTVAMVALRGGMSLCGWVGDSRVYRSRHGVLTQMSHDHSQVQEMVDSGMLTMDEARRHPAGNVVTRAVGAADEVEVDFTVVPAQPGDIFLVCSDGLTGVVEDSEIGEIIRSGECSEIVQALLHMALVRQVRDNVTVVVAKIDG